MVYPKRFVDFYHGLYNPRIATGIITHPASHLWGITNELPTYPPSNLCA